MTLNNDMDAVANAAKKTREIHGSKALEGIIPGPTPSKEVSSGSLRDITLGELFDIQTQINIPNKLKDFKWLEVRNKMLKALMKKHGISERDAIDIVMLDIEGLKVGVKS